MFYHDVDEPDNSGHIYLYGSHFRKNRNYHPILKIYRFNQQFYTRRLNLQMRFNLFQQKQIINFLNFFFKLLILISYN